MPFEKNSLKRYNTHTLSCAFSKRYTVKVFICLVPYILELQATSYAAFHYKRVQQNVFVKKRTKTDFFTLLILEYFCSGNLLELNNHSTLFSLITV